jgi:tRNA nucleotidyltransferase/poly(A) polymerase
MAMDILPKNFGDLYDPLGGITDLKKKQLRTPLDPDVTFSDDPLRMIRAAYFSAKLEFILTEECLTSMKNQAGRITIVSWERITRELKKILKTRKPSIGLSILQDTDLMKHVFPEISVMHGMEQVKKWHHKDVFYHTLQVVDNAAELSDKMACSGFRNIMNQSSKPNRHLIRQFRSIIYYLKSVVKYILVMPFFYLFHSMHNTNFRENVFHQISILKNGKPNGRFSCFEYFL